MRLSLVGQNQTSLSELADGHGNQLGGIIRRVLAHRGWTKEADKRLDRAEELLAEAGARKVGDSSKEGGMRAMSEES